jgi:tetratricopeptide (TPR) repeat protein
MKSILLLMLTATVMLGQENAVLQQMRAFALANNGNGVDSLLKTISGKPEYKLEHQLYTGYLQLLDRDYEGALDNIENYTEERDTSAFAYFLLGNAYATKAMLGNKITAMFIISDISENWEKALEIDPDFIPATIALFNFNLRAPMVGDKDKALEYAKSLLGKNPLVANSLLVAYYATTENLVKAEEHIKVLQKHPKRQDKSARPLLLSAYNSMGYAFMKKEKTKSFDYFKAAIDLAPDQGNPYDSMGDFYFHYEEYAAALTHYQKAYDTNLQMQYTLLNVGKTLEKLERIDEARQTYQKLMAETGEGNLYDQAEERLEALIE